MTSKTATSPVADALALALGITALEPARGSLTNHEAAERLYVATDRHATPPRVDATPPGQYGLEFGPGVFGSARPKSRLLSAVFGEQKSRAGATTPASARVILLMSGATQGAAPLRRPLRGRGRGEPVVLEEDADNDEGATARPIMRLRRAASARLGASAPPLPRPATVPRRRRGADEIPSSAARRKPRGDDLVRDRVRSDASLPEGGRRFGLSASPIWHARTRRDGMSCRQQ